MSPTTAQLNTILKAISKYDISASEFITSLFTNTTHNAVTNLSCNTHTILDSIGSYSSTETSATEWAERKMTDHYASEIVTLASKESRLHFTANAVTREQLLGFDIQDTSEVIHSLAPRVSKLLGTLLTANEAINSRRQYELDGRKEKHTENLERPNRVAESDIEIGDVGDTVHEPEGSYDQAEKRRNELLKIKKVMCTSIMMHSTNQRCNALQSAIGIFLHASGTPDTVRGMLSHMGVSISPATINQAITNLSKETINDMKAVGHTLLTSYAYDNLDIDLKHLVPTVEQPEESLVHLTTGTMLPLNHGVKLEDLNCSDELWKRSKNNRHAQKEDIPTVELEDLLRLYPETRDEFHMLQRDRYNAWKFLYDLVNFGPVYFRQFKTDLGEPEIIEQIPIVKTKQVPNMALDQAETTPAENASAMDSFLRQGGIGEKEPHLKKIRNYVVLVFGDLLTGEHLRSLLESCSEERTPWRRLQFIVYVMGLFHLKMACADAIWRIFIRPLNASSEQLRDENALLQHVAQIRPKETGKIKSKPGFRRMHEVIQHIGIVSRLDCWRLEAERLNPQCKTIEEFAETKPGWQWLLEMARSLSFDKVGKAYNVSEYLLEPEHERDTQYENMLLQHQYFLLYEEITFALNAGDIGRIEASFMLWAFIFRGCGKHKYAAELKRYLENVHFVYPDGLKRAVRMNILCNPTGKKGRFRAINWLVEHNNLYIKHIYGGKFSNHQKQQIIKESSLIEVYKNIRIQFERMFCLEDQTTHHSPPNMTETFQKLLNYMEEHDANRFVKGRKSSHIVKNALGIGMLIMTTEGPNSKCVAESEWEDLPDEAEVDDDGTLDL